MNGWLPAGARLHMVPTERADSAHARLLEARSCSSQRSYKARKHAACLALTNNHVHEKSSL
jgi:hypothetical protein